MEKYQNAGNVVWSWCGPRRSGAYDTEGRSGDPGDRCYRTELVSGVPSFCAVAASLKIPLTEGKEMLHVIPASYKEEVDMKETGTYILMKTGRRLQNVKEQLYSAGFQNESVFLAENSGMTDEKIYRTMVRIRRDTFQH